MKHLFHAIRVLRTLLLKENVPVLDAASHIIRQALPNMDCNIDEDSTSRGCSGGINCEGMTLIGWSK